MTGMPDLLTIAVTGVDWWLSSWGPVNELALEHMGLDVKWSVIGGSKTAWNDGHVGPKLCVQAQAYGGPSYLSFVWPMNFCDGEVGDGWGCVLPEGHPGMHKSDEDDRDEVPA